jgi:phosphate transport system substrate-binding protein
VAGANRTPDPDNPVLVLQQAVPCGGGQNGSSVLLALISYSTTSTGLINNSGKSIQPTNEAFQAAAANADWAHAPGYYLILTDQPGDKSWPIVASTFILMHKDAADKAASQEALKFFKFAIEKGDKMAEELDYIPMPDNVVKLIEKTWSEIKT